MKKCSNHEILSRKSVGNNFFRVDGPEGLTIVQDFIVNFSQDFQVGVSQNDVRFALNFSLSQIADQIPLVTLFQTYRLLKAEYNLMPNAVIIPDSFLGPESYLNAIESFVVYSVPWSRLSRDTPLAQLPPFLNNYPGAQSQSAPFEYVKLQPRVESPPAGVGNFQAVYSVYARDWGSVRICNDNPQYILEANSESGVSPLDSGITYANAPLYLVTNSKRDGTLWSTALVDIDFHAAPVAIARRVRFTRQVKFTIEFGGIVWRHNVLSHYGVGPLLPSAEVIYSNKEQVLGNHMVCGFTPNNRDDDDASQTDERDDEPDTGPIRPSKFRRLGPNNRKRPSSYSSRDESRMSSIISGEIYKRPSKSHSNKSTTSQNQESTRSYSGIQILPSKKGSTLSRTREYDADDEGTQDTIILSQEDSN